MPEYTEIPNEPRNDPHVEAFMYDAEDNGPRLTRLACRVFRAVVLGSDQHTEQVNRWFAAREWCAEQFGIPGLAWTYERYGYVILFTEEDAAFAFRMRWC